MTAVELLKFQIDACGGQLSKTLHGVDDKHKDFRLHDGGMSFAEQVTHLADVYNSVLVEGGTDYEWGSFEPASNEWDAMVAEALELREKAAAKLLVDDDEKLKLGADFIVSHDLYHVGQMATMRLNVYPDWNFYEIYS